MTVTCWNDCGTEMVKICGRLDLVSAEEIEFIKRGYRSKGRKCESGTDYEEVVLYKSPKGTV